MVEETGDENKVSVVDLGEIHTYGRDNIPQELPLLPIKNTVVLPFTALPLAVGKERSIEAVQKAMAGQRIISAFLLKSEARNKDQISEEEIHSVGTACLILKMLKMPDASLRLLVQGLEKLKLVKLTATDPFITANVEVMAESFRRSTRLEALMRSVTDRLHKIISLAPHLPDELSTAAMSLEDPLVLAYLVTSLIKMEPEKRQSILELTSVEEKLETLIPILDREAEILELGGKIQSEVAGEISKTQREYFLREQLKAIKRELGEEDEQTAEIHEIEKKLKEIDLPNEVRKEARRELARMGNIPTASPERHLIRTYLDWIIELPWKVETKDNLDLERARKILDKDHYNLEKVKERIIEYLSVRSLKKDMKGPILCFVGAPGVGKTSLGQSIARALERKFVRMSLGGMRDEAEIRGHRRTYIGALPGRLIQNLRRAGSRNPVFMLDEIDKVGADFRGDPSSALLEVLDPEQNNSFTDHYLNLPFDLSRVLFITTANILQTIQPALRDRMEIIHLSGYTTEEKIHIAQRYLIPKQVKENGLNEKQISFEQDAISHIITDHTHEAGVRNLEREIASVCRKTAHQIATGKAKKTKITPTNLADFLGPQKVYSEVARRTSAPGVATGLAWTEAGGDILFIEAIKMSGNRNLTITGQLGEVMKESVKAALSYIRSIASKLKVDEKFFDKYDLHIHVPAGAIPKDGPSAGIAIATAIASIMTEKPVRNDIAMTGEITLAGLVLPVGGIKEKVLAAKRAGINHVILPKRNENDLQEIPEELRRDMQFQYVDKLDEVLKTALR